MAHPPLASVRQLGCARGGRDVLAGVSFELARGGALTVRGANGSGKTTLLRALAGLLPVSGGEIAFADGAEASDAAVYVGHADGVKRALSVAEHLSYWRALHGDAGDIEAAFEAFSLAALRDAPAAILSAGQRKRLALSRLFVCGRPLWLLDEPANSLDAASTRALIAAIERHRDKGGAAIVATHTDLSLSGAETMELGGA